MIAAGFYFLLGVVVGMGIVWTVTRRAIQPPDDPAAAHAAAQAAAQAASQASLQSAIGAMQERVESYQARLSALDRERAAEQARLQAQIERLASTGALMAQEAKTLRDALTKSSSIRGTWGEAVLANLFNACGLNPGRDYDLQAHVSGEGGDARLRPDAIVHLPSGRDLVIDAKASLTAYLEGLEQLEAGPREAAFTRFAQVLRARVRELAGKEYSRYLANSLPCVVMFVPSESAFRAALDADAELFLYGQNQQPAVVLSSPSTLFPLISIIAQGWQQQQASKQMQELMGEVREFGSRLQTFLGHLQGVGKNIDAAGKSFNAAVASYRSRLSPSLQRVRELGSGWPEPDELKPVDNRPLLADSASGGGAEP